MKEIPLTKGAVAIVDDEDYEFLAQRQWQLNTMGYAVGSAWMNGKNRCERMHRLIAGVRDPRVKVDHINGDKLDNRRVNLRLCTQSQNQMNRGPQINNTSGFKGISRRSDCNRWKAKIVVNGRAIHLGTYGSPEEAHAAYCRAAKELHGDFANTGEKNAQIQR